MDEIERLTEQVQILENQANEYDGTDPRRAELFKAAGKVKNQLVTLLNSKGVPVQQQPQQTGPNIPDPATYWDNEDKAVSGYFDNLTDDMKAYFSTPDFPDAPSMPVQTVTPTRESEDEEQRQMRIRILHAIGVF